jgi:chromosome segregation ATPase
MNSGARTGAQRLSLVVLALALAGAGYFAFVQADAARAGLEREATSSAERAAAAIGSRLISEDLDGSIGEGRTTALTTFVERRVFVNEATESVKVWNTDAVVVFADEQALQGTENRDLRSKLSRILELGTRTEVVSGLLHVFVPVPVGEDGGPSVVVELTRPYGQIASAGQPWLFVTVAAGLLAVLALVVAIRWRGRSAPLRSAPGFSSQPSGDVSAAFRNERETRQRAEQALEASRSDESKLRGEVERLTRDMREAERWISEKDTAISQHESKVRAAEERAERLEAALRSGSDRQESGRKTETELKEARAELDATRGRLDALERAQVAAAQDAQARLEDLEEQARRAREEAEQAQAELDHASAALAEAREEGSKLKEQVLAAEAAGTGATEIEARVAEAEARAAAADARAAAAESRAKDAEARAAAAEPLEGGVAPTKELADARLQVVRLREALDETRDESAAERESRQRLETRVSMFDAEREALEATHFAALARTDTAHEDLSHVRKELGLLSKQLEESTSRAAYAEAKVVQLSENIRDLEARPDLTPEFDAARRELEAARSDLATARAELDANKEQTEAARAQADATRAQAEARSRELDAARADLEGLTSRLAAAESELRASRTREEAAADEIERARSEAESAGIAARAASEQIDAARAEAEKVLQRLDEHVQRTAHAEARVLELSTTVRELEARPDLSVDLEATRGALETARADVRSREDELAGVRTELDAMQASARSEIEAATRELDSTRSELETVRQNFDNARSEFDAFRQEFDSARFELDTIRQDFDTTRSELEATRAELDTHKNQTEAARADLEAARAQAEERSQELEAARAQAEKRSQELEAARADLEGLTSRVAAAESEVQASRSREEAAANEIERARSEAESAGIAARAASEQIDATRAESEELLQRLDEHMQRAAHAEARVLELSTTVRDLESRPDLSVDVEEARGALEVARADVQARENELAGVRTELDALRRSLQATREHSESADSELTRLRSEVEAMEAELARTRSEAEAADRTAGDVSAELKKLEDRAAGAEARVLQLTAMARDLEDRPDLGPELAAARAEVEALSARLSATTDELAAARSEAQSSHVGLQGTRDELQTLRAATESASAELDAARAELDAARAELQALQEDARSARTDADGSVVELEALRAQMAELSVRAEAAERQATEHRTHGEELARRNAELRQEAGIEARRFEEEAAVSRVRLEEMERVVSHLQDQLGASTSGESGAEIEAIAGKLHTAESRIEELEANLRDEKTRVAELAVQGSATAADQPDADALAPGAADEMLEALSMDAKRSISAIFGLARTLSTGVGGDGKGRMLQQLMTQARRMEHAIGDILDADQLARGEAVLQRRSTELDTLVRRVAAEFPLGAERDIEVVAETATIQVDPMRVERIIDDMLTSAVGRTSVGDRIILRLERVDGGVIISVEDGLPPADEGVGAAATFLAKLHDGWARVEALDDRTASYRVFIPSIRPDTMNGGASADRAAAVS